MSFASITTGASLNAGERVWHDVIAVAIARGLITIEEGAVMWEFLKHPQFQERRANGRKIRREELGE